MKEKVLVRMMLVNNESKKYIGAVEEHYLSDYLKIRESNQNTISLRDFSDIITRLESELHNKINQAEYKDLAVKRSVAFNSWQRLKSTKKESLRDQQAVMIWKETEEVINYIHTSLPELQKKYNFSTDERPYFGSGNPKNAALTILCNEIHVFVEMLLCNIHTTALVDPGHLKDDHILTNHYRSIRETLTDILRQELNYTARDKQCFHWLSAIHQICMEDVGIDPEKILAQIESKQTQKQIVSDIFNEARIEDVLIGDRIHHQYSVSWLKTNPDKLERIKLISITLEKVTATGKLLESLKDETVNFSDDIEAQNKLNERISKLM